MACHVYVLYSERFRKIYIGSTSNLEKRVQSHNSLATKGWTIKFRPWALFHVEEFDDKRSALKRERELKSAKGRESIGEMIQKNILPNGSYPPVGGHRLEPACRPACR